MKELRGWNGWMKTARTTRAMKEPVHSISRGSHEREGLAVSNDKTSFTFTQTLMGVKSYCEFDGLDIEGNNGWRRRVRSELQNYGKKPSRLQQGCLEIDDYYRHIYSNRWYIGTCVLTINYTTLHVDITNYRLETNCIDRITLMF